MAPTQAENTGAAIIFIISGLVLVLLTFMVAKLVNWIFQY
jgi:hypothetical protein